MPEPDVRSALAALHAECWAWALACNGRDRQRAEEALQRAYERILEGQARFRQRSSFKTFVFGVIRTTSRERHPRLHAPLTSTIVDAGLTPDALAAAAERRENLLAALAQLSQRQHEVIELVFYHELTIDEAATVMHVSIGSARTHYERGKTRLRALLSKEAMEV
jgi:RNA polymerase sigma-70 factor (ECF subfamily)